MFQLTIQGHTPSLRSSRLEFKGRSACYSTYCHLPLAPTIHIHTCTQTHTHKHVHTHTCVDAHTYIHTWVCAHTHAWMHIYSHTHTHTCIHTLVHAHMHTHKHTHIQEVWQVPRRTLLAGWQASLCSASSLIPFKTRKECFSTQWGGSSYTNYQPKFSSRDTPGHSSMETLLPNDSRLWQVSTQSHSIPLEKGLDSTLF